MKPNQYDTNWARIFTYLTCPLDRDQIITEYMEFNLYVQYYLEADYFDVASNNTYYFNSLINSFRHNPEKIMARYKVIKEEISGSVDSNKEDKEHDS